MSEGQGWPEFGAAPVGRDAQGTAQRQPFGAHGFGDFCRNKSHPPKAEAFDLFNSPAKQKPVVHGCSAVRAIATHRPDRSAAILTYPRLEGCRASQHDRRASADCPRARDGPSSARRLSGETRREPRSGSRSAQMVLVTFAVTKVIRRRRKLLILALALEQQSAKQSRIAQTHCPRR